MQDDQAYINDLLRDHYPSLYSVVVSLVRSPDVAKDIVQDVIIRFWEKKKRLDDVKSAGDFLFIMARNEALNYLRNARRERRKRQKLHFPSSEEPAITSLLIEQDSISFLLQAIRRLPPQSARVMELVLSGYENQEIASEMAISINTVKTLKYAATRKLRDYFAGRGITKKPPGFF
jgi:RNA polymerase sigma-70 factor (ECF subfamily)